MGGIIFPSALFIGPFMVTVQSAKVHVWAPWPKAILYGLLFSLLSKVLRTLSLDVVVVPPDCRKRLSWPVDHVISFLRAEKLLFR